MVSSARYWRSKRASGTQGRVSLLFLPQNSFHVSAVQLCYKEALYMYLGHLPDFLKEKKRRKQRKKNLSSGAPDLRNMEAVSGWAALNAGRQIYNWAGRKLMANPDDGMGYLFLSIFPSSLLCPTWVLGLSHFMFSQHFIFCSFYWPKLKFLHGFLC